MGTGHTGCRYPPCPAGMVEVGTSCYIPVNKTEKNTYEEAKLECQRLGGEVASVNLTDVEAGLETLNEIGLRNNFHNIWIGLSDAKFEGTFIWDDGSFGSLSGVDMLENTQEKDCVSMATYTKTLSIDRCDEEYNFICRAPLYTKPCDEGYKYINGSCFAVSKEDHTYYEAYMACSLNGGDLVSVESLEANELLSQFLFTSGASEAWFGLQQNYLNKDLTYADGTPPAYTPLTFQASNDSQACYILGRWEARDCNSVVGAYICNRGPNVKKTCPGESIRFGDECFKVKITEPEPWYDARQVCLDMGGDLLTIKSEAQQQFLIDLITKKEAQTDYWIGLFENGTNSFYNWVDNSNWAVGDYNNWAASQPDDNTEGYNCIKMRSDSSYMWDDVLCEQNLPFICEYKNTPCEEMATCHSEGECSKGQCRCKPGYQGDGQKVCVDINECEYSPCTEHATCENFAGGHNCTCDEGYEWNGVMCINILACTGQSDCHIDALCEPITLLCQCNIGYHGDGKVSCIDIDECTEDVDLCHEHATCVNNVGSFECVCNDGHYGDGFSCVGTPKDCEDLRLRNPEKKTGTYMIDADGSGPLKAMKVICLIYDDYAVTKIEHNRMGDSKVKNNRDPYSATYTVQYKHGVSYNQIRTLVTESTYCYQLIRFRCRGGSLIDTTYFEDVEGNQTETNKCPCSTINACAEGTTSGLCNCDGSLGQEQKDFFKVTKEEASLPITKFASGGTSPQRQLWLWMTPLYCGPRQIGVPLDCHDAKFNRLYRYGVDNVFDIDPDGPEGDNPPFNVKCIVQRYKHVGVTEIPIAGPPGPQNPGPDPETTVGYPVNETYIPPLKITSGFCLQKLAYTCQRSPLLEAGGGFVGPDGVTQYSSWGSALDTQEECACGVLENCADPSKSCDCDLADDVDRQDFGFILDEGQVPITKVKLPVQPDGNRTYEVGSLACAPFQFDIPASCQEYRYKGYSYSYTYLIDPDGPRKNNNENNLEPFLVECEMEDEPRVGCAIISTDGSVQTLEQTAAVKRRSQYCIDLGNNKERCCELYLQCAHMWNNYKYVHGENQLADGRYTINPGGINGEPFEVTCDFPLKTILFPTVGSSTTIDSKTVDDPSYFAKPGAQCTTVDYEGVTTKQLRELTEVSEHCQQYAKYNCRQASFDNLKWSNREGDEMTGWAGAAGLPECACGAQDACLGGTDDACNCDANSPDLQSDFGTFVDKTVLPVSEVCLGYNNLTEYTKQNRGYAEYILGQFICAPKHYDIWKTCQEVRNKREKDSRVYLLDSDGPSQSNLLPFPAFCDMTYDPPIGETTITHTRGDKCDNSEIPDEGGDVTIVYNSATLAQMKALAAASVYCKQEVTYQCNHTPLDLNATAGYGLYDVNGIRLDYWAGNTGGTGCLDGSCKCSHNVETEVGGWVTDKHVLPITKISLGPVADGGSRCVNVGPLRCFTLHRDCHEIHLTNNKHNPNRNNHYAIDPDLVDQPDGGEEPFSGVCDFRFVKNTGLTNIFRYSPKVSVPESLPGSRPYIINYDRASFDQVRGLVEHSIFCKQEIMYYSRGLPLLNGFDPDYTYFVGGESHVSKIWPGADTSPNVEGCACAALGICLADASCRSDTYTGTTELLEGGMLTNSDYMPVKEVIYGGAGDGRHASFMVGKIACGPVPFGFPKNCEEARKKRNLKTAEVQLWPDSSVDPFTAHCDDELHPGSSVTMIPTKKEVQKVTGSHGSVTVTYLGADYDQVRALVKTQPYCYLPVKVMCTETQFMGVDPEHNYWKGGTEDEHEHEHENYFGHGTAGQDMCRCGVDKKCGGHDGKDAMSARKCNCDIGDKQWRADAGILAVQNDLPLRELFLHLGEKPDAEFLVEIGNLYCSPKQLNLNECDLGFHDCHEHAECVDLPGRYDCTCKVGYQGLGRTEDPNVYANGRECPDDDECELQKCPATAECENTIGSYACHCRPGFRHVGPFECEDIDECAEQSHDCDVNAHCINTFGSFKCACNEGYRGTGRIGHCESVGTCTCWGDPHCLSFDRKILHFQGSCSYLMARDGCEDGIPSETPTFQVVTKFWREYMVTESRVSWVKEVYVYILGNVFQFNQGGKVLRNGVTLNKLPSIPIPGEDVTIRMVGNFVVLSWQSAGIEVKWSGTTQATVVVPSRYQSKMCGLCGNYDSLTTHEWRVGPMCDAGNALNVTDNPNTFGASWLMREAADTEAEYKECKEDCDRPEEPLCEPDKESYAEEECNKIFDIEGPFKECLAEMNLLDITMLYESCKYDLCKVEDIDRSYCTMAEALTSMCQQVYGINTGNWRGERCPIKCAEGLTYHRCGSACEPTCAQLEEGFDCEYSCQEGCRCPEGMVREGDLCVPPSQCGCFVNGVSYAINDRVVTEDCSEECYCRSFSGDLECNPIECDDQAVCSIVDGDRDCRCNLGYKGDGQTCDDIDECIEEVPAPCDPNAHCENVIGSYNCLCKQGYRGDGHTCDDVDECLEGFEDCQDHSTCRNTFGSYECPCDSGYTKVNGTCKDIDECESLRDDCNRTTSTCHNMPGSYYCACKSGFGAPVSFGFAAVVASRTGRVACQDNDECVSPSNCDRNASCSNYVGSFECSCQKGYIGDGSPGSCEDDDECSHDSRNNCHEKADCINTVGSFTCRCKIGYTGDGVFECEGEDPPPCNETCVSNAECVAVRADLSECQCKKGYKEYPLGNEVYCIDINECNEVDSTSCDPNADCYNTQGSYTCKCIAGFEGDGTYCKDINECNREQPCSRNAECVNTVGSYTCACYEGFEGNGKTCDNIDECVKHTHNCGVHAHCVDTIGGFSCYCDTGYNGHCDECRDIDECTTGLHNCHLLYGVCINTEGSFMCECKPGFTGQGITCYDENECDMGTFQCDEFSKCVNFPGMYECLCNRGYEKDEDGNCQDKNECTTSESDCHADASCTNTEGSYTCECKDGYIGDGFYCQDDSTANCAEIKCGNHSDCVQVAQDTVECRCRHGYRLSGNNVDCEATDPCSEAVCDSNAYCQVRAGFAYCFCEAGYRGDGKICQSYDPCDDFWICGLNTKCMNHRNGSHSCDCNPGFTRIDKFACEDIDECGIEVDSCPDNSECINTIGSYDCFCESGFEEEYVDDAQVCTDVNECTESLHDCDSEERARCVNNEGSYDCECLPPYIGTGQICYENNEPNCHKSCSGVGQYCKINSTGGQECACGIGFTTDSDNPLICTDINECLDGHSCHDEATCKNVAPGYICVCDVGYLGNGMLCEDKDECRGDNDCHEDAWCDNEPLGSYTCTCNTGFEGDGYNCTLIPPERDICGCGPNGTCYSRSMRCECKAGYQPDYTRTTDKCQDVDECLEGDKCHVTAVCENLDGGYTCTCPSGSEGNGFLYCDEDECKTGNNKCDDNAFCVNTFEFYKCFCKHGYVGDGFKCLKVTDPCEEQNINCGDNAFCVSKEDGQYRCECKGGYKGDGESCEDVNECNAEDEYQHECHENAVCYNTDGSYICRCKTGFIGSGKSCTDINECNEADSDGSGRCAGEADCQNSVGGFSCTCKPGLDGDGNNCKPVVACGGMCGDNAHCESTSSGGHICVCNRGYAGNPIAGCTDIDECDLETDTCHENADCVNEEGSFTCECKDGYYGNGKTCFDENECLKELDNDCTGGNEECVNTPGSHSCTCMEGYIREGDDCVDVDECEDELDNCNENASCDNTAGGYTCTCKTGFYGDGIICIDCVGPCANCDEGYIWNGELCMEINECFMADYSVYADHCVNADCENTPTGYICNCKGGYSRLSDLECTDKDECSDPNACNSHGECINTPGSYVCKCYDGYVWTDQGCEDINECAGINVCGPPDSSTCENTGGNYSCTCKDGYVMVDKKCEDVDECIDRTDICGLEALCINIPGSYNCQCSSGYKLFDLVCNDINECEDRTACDINANCENNDGSYKCTCDPGFIGDGHLCIPICGPDTCNEQATCSVVDGMPVCKCRCDFPECEVLGEVCGTDGQTYASHGTLIMHACQNQRRISFAYRGQCQIDCNQATCSLYKECSMGDNNLPKCTCQECTEEENNSGYVCTKAGDTYYNKCVMKMIQCENDGEDVVDYKGSCNHPVDCQYNEWQSWAHCTKTCGQGEKTRYRSIKRMAKNGGRPCKIYKQTVPCFMPACPGDQCNGVICTRTAAICVVQQYVGRCQCIDCFYEKHQHICAYVGDLKETWPNLCTAKREACLANTTLSVIHPGKCGEEEPSEPLDCTVMPHYSKYNDTATGCITKETVQVNTCKGGCGQELGFCCEPKTHKSIHTLFECANGYQRAGKMLQVTSCSCVPDVREQEAAVEGNGTV